jgi:hypothetical protein
MIKVISMILIIIGSMNIGAWFVWDNHHFPALGLALLVGGLLIYIVKEDE